MNTEKETAILISLDKDKRLTVDAKGTILPEAIQLCLAAIEAMCKSTLARANDPKLEQSLREDMYDMINLGASTLLNKMFPEIEMRPDISVDAILEEENKLIDKKGQEYKEAYEQSAQAEKDIYEHNIAKANLALQNMNRAEKRKLGIRKKAVK